MSKSGKSRNPLVKRVAGLAAVGAVIVVSVPVLANGAPRDRSAAGAQAQDQPADETALRFVPTDGATRGETGVGPKTLTAADGAELARTGSLTLKIKTWRAGTVSAVGTSPVGEETSEPGTTAPDGWAEVGKDSERITEPASVEATGSGLVELTLRLTPAARDAYAAGADDKMLLRISSSSSRGSMVTFLPMGG
jgi:hypothetical protein